MKFLISGFEAFLDFNINPTELLVNSLRELNFNAVVLPVEYEKSFLVLKQHIDIIKPDVVLSFGVAVDREQIELERIAINCQSSNKPDNSGQTFLKSKIQNSGPDGVFSNIEVDNVVHEVNLNMAKLINKNKIRVSNSAGTYVCNSLMYNLVLDGIKNNYLAGFVHVPNKIDADSIEYYKIVVLELQKAILNIYAKK